MTQLRETGEISTGELLDGRYRLDERIGEGGMARVYRAHDTILGRTVAVKVLRAPVDELGAIQRARSETALLASLNHHGLVTLFDARVSDDDISYLVMELVEGCTLRERIARGPIASAEAASLTIDIAEALHVAHSAGIVHRDIKPSNVLLWKSPLPTREWRAKLADFGIAYLLDSSRVTTPGLMVGTVAYIAPEQARGAQPAPAADIYALGLMMIEALTGTRPFADAEGIGTVMARLANAPTVPDSLEAPWQHLLRWMTATRPEDRPTAIEVAVAASRLLPGAAATFVDESTAAVPVGTLATAAAASGADAATGVTALLPLDAPTGRTVAVSAAAPVLAATPLPAAPTGRRSSAASRRRRRSGIATAVVSARGAGQRDRGRRAVVELAVRESRTGSQSAVEGARGHGSGGRIDPGRRGARAFGGARGARGGALRHRQQRHGKRRRQRQQRTRQEQRERQGQGRQGQVVAVPRARPAASRLDGEGL